MSLYDVLRVRTLNVDEYERYLYMLPDAPLPRAMANAVARLQLEFDDQVDTAVDAELKQQEELETGFPDGVCPQCGYEPDN